MHHEHQHGKVAQVHRIGIVADPRRQPAHGLCAGLHIGQPGQHQHHGQRGRADQRQIVEATAGNAAPVDAHEMEHRRHRASHQQRAQQRLGALPAAPPAGMPTVENGRSHAPARGVEVHDGDATDVVVPLEEMLRRRAQGTQDRGHGDQRQRHCPEQVVARRPPEQRHQAEQQRHQRVKPFVQRQRPGLGKEQRLFLRPQQILRKRRERPRKPPFLDAPPGQRGVDGQEQVVVGNGPEPAPQPEITRARPPAGTCLEAADHHRADQEATQHEQPFDREHRAGTQGRAPAFPFRQPVGHEETQVGVVHQHHADGQRAQHIEPEVALVAWRGLAHDVPPTRCPLAWPARNSCQDLDRHNRSRLRTCQPR